MALDFWGALRRAVTLPRSKNSLSDILGETRAKQLQRLGFILLTREIRELFAQAPMPLHQLKGLAWGLVSEHLDLHELAEADWLKAKAIFEALFNDKEPLGYIEEKVIDALRKGLKVDV